LELAGYHLPSINSKYSFKNGLNIVSGRFCSGKTILLSSISAAFLGTNYHDQWIQGDSAHINSPEQFFPNQEPNIIVKFDWEGNSYELRKEFTKGQGVKCELFAISDDGTKTLQSEGYLAIEQCMKISGVRLLGIGEIHKASNDVLENRWFLEEYAEERKIIWDLLAKYRPDYLLRYSGLLDSENPIRPLGGMGGAPYRFLRFMTIIASSVRNRNREILLLDDVLSRSMEQSYVETVLRILSEEGIYKQVILTLDFEFHGLNMLEDNSITNHIITLPNPTNHQ